MSSGNSSTAAAVTQSTATTTTTASCPPAPINPPTIANTTIASTSAASSSGRRPNLNLTTLDKIKRFFFSKDEWEAYLIEKMEEQEKKKGKQFLSSKDHFFLQKKSH